LPTIISFDFPTEHPVNSSTESTARKGTAPDGGNFRIMTFFMTQQHHRVLMSKCTAGALISIVMIVPVLNNQVKSYGF
jgi:hypothetical protein